MRFRSLAGCAWQAHGARSRGKGSRSRPDPPLACSGARLAQRERPSCVTRCRAVDSAAERVKVNVTFLPKRA